MIKPTNAADIWTVFNSCLYYILILWPWANYIYYLLVYNIPVILEMVFNLYFFTCKFRIIMLPAPTKTSSRLIDTLNNFAYYICLLYSKLDVLVEWLNYITLMRKIFQIKMFYYFKGVFCISKWHVDVFSDSVGI